jgi:DNA polymerase-1
MELLCMSKLRLCFDIETNGFLPDVNKIWLLVAIDSDTGQIHAFSDYDAGLPPISEGLAFISTADILYGHNIVGYDLPVLDHILGFKLPASVKVIDTWILSLLTQYKRSHKHGLAGWGEKFGFPKLPFDDFSQYSQEMKTYCIRDVELNVLVYKDLAATASKIIRKYPTFVTGMEVEMEFAAIESDIRRKGWVFDMPMAVNLLEEMDAKLTAIDLVLEPKIGMRCIKTDGTDSKEPTWRKDGCYTVATVSHFGYSQESGRDDDRPIEGAFCRISYEQGRVGQIAVVKDYLYSIGWVPDEWNVEKINGKWVNKSPKITESSLSKLGPEAQSISEYYMIRSRKGILEGWIKEATATGRLHGRMWTIGTPTFRCRHEVVANVPSIQFNKAGDILIGAEGGYGKEMRSLLHCEPGTSIIGADSAGNQMRGLCHYLNNEEFTNEVINGDVHQRNADALGVSRKLAKPFLYAFLFGGGAAKLGNILTGKSDAKVGAKAKSAFQNSIPGMKRLTDDLEAEYERTSAAFGASDAFIRGIDGRLVFVSSPHQVLNYQLQTAEGVTCKAAIVYMKRELDKRGIQHYFALHYHDEFVVVVKDQYAEEVAELAVEAFTEAPKWFGINCMNGAAHIGKRYDEVH